MQLIIKHKTKTINIEANPSDTIENLKHMIQAEEYILIEQMILTFSGKLLKNDKIVSDYNIIDQSILKLF
jgi:hypothetical protein